MEALSRSATQCHRANDSWSSKQNTSPITLATPSRFFSARPPPETPTRVSRRRQFGHLPPFQPHTGDLTRPLDICADEFLRSCRFEIICAQALQLASILPEAAPPWHFVSFAESAMHHWYEAFLVEFTTCFARRLHLRQSFPSQAVFTATGDVTFEEDMKAYNAEIVAHVNAILQSFNTTWPFRHLGSLEDLSIDITQPNAVVAAMALRESSQIAEYPPKADWRAGEPLQAEYRRRLRMFRVGVTRLIQEREGDRWILTVPEQLERGVAAYEEFYIAHLRQGILARNGTSTLGPDVVYVA